MNHKWIPTLIVSLFAVCTSSSQVVLSIPNGGERWDGGSRQYVHWTGGGQLLKVELTTNNGLSWTVLSPSVPVGYWMLGFDCPDIASDECRVRITSTADTSDSDASDSAFSIRSSAAGSAWVPRNSGTSFDLRSVTFIDQSRGWACGDSGTLLATTDGGLHWGPSATGTAHSLYAVRFSQTLVGIAAGAHGTILRSTDEGSTWQAVVSGTTNTLHAVAFHGSGVASAVGEDGTIIRSIDSGFSWQEVLSGTTTTLSAVSFLDTLHGSIAGGDGPGGGGPPFVLISSNGGVSWTLKPTNTDAFGWRSIAYLPDSVLVVAGEYSWSFGSRSTIARSTNAGTHWSEVLGFSNIGAGGGPIFYFAEIVFLDSMHGFAAGYGDGSGIFVRTATGGASWDLPGSYYLRSPGNALWFVTPTNGTIVGAGGAIFQTTSGGVVSFKGNPAQSPVRTMRLFQNYPNPFNPNTTIQFEIHKTLFVSLKVFDLLGREVAVLAREVMHPGVHQRTLNTRDLASGTYLCRLEADNSIRTSKLILVK